MAGAAGLVRDQCFHARAQLGDAIETFLAHDEQRRGEGIGFSGRREDDGRQPSVIRGLAGAWIEHMTISSFVPLKGFAPDSRDRERLVLERHDREESSSDVRVSRKALLLGRPCANRLSFVEMRRCRDGWEASPAWSVFDGHVPGVGAGRTADRMDGAGAAVQ